MGLSKIRIIPKTLSLFFNMTVYFVRRYDGTFVKYGFQWASDIQEAALYTSIGPARSRVTRWSRLRPNEPLLTILAITFTEQDCQVLDQTDRTRTLNKRKQQRDKEREQRRIADKIQRLEAERIRINNELKQLS